MTTLRRRLRRPPLRTQIVVLVVALLAVLSAIITTVSSLTLQGNLVRQVDTQLLNVSSRASGARPAAPGTRPGPQGQPPSSFRPGTSDSSTGDSDRPGPGDQIPNAVAGGTIVVRMSDTTVAQAGYFDPENGTYQDLTDAQVAALTALTNSQSPTQAHLPDIGAVRAIALIGQSGDRFITAIPLTSVHATMRDYIAVSVGASAIVLLIAGLIGALLVRRSLRPLGRVADAATEVSHMELSRGEVAQIPRVEVNPTGVTEADQVGIAFNRMLDHVEASLGARHSSEMQVRQFVADASHELRTPLASIRGYAELIERSSADLPTSTQRSVDRIHSEAVRMGGLVEDMLLLARLDAGRPLDRAEVDLTALAIDAVSDAHAAGGDHTWLLDLSEEEPVVVHGDEARLRQVLVNLLANARIHTPAGTTVRATVSRTATGARIEVADNGPGIDPSALPTIFQRFTRADSARNRVSGSTGLGLAIVSAIVKSHGGRIDVASEPGNTVFTVEVPAG